MLDLILSNLGAIRLELIAGAIRTLAIYIVAIVATRIAGLRSLSKMPAFDFAMPVAIGSLIASTAAGQASPATAVIGGVVLCTAQFAVASLRHSGRLSGAVDNSPLLLMDGARVLHDNLAVGGVTLDDLHSKLPEANVRNYLHVHSEVLEATGDPSVLHSEKEFSSDLPWGFCRQQPRPNENTVKAPPVSNK